MSSWRALLRGDPLPWLLEKRDPSVRALTLRNILDRSPRDPELREANARAMASPPLSTILRRQGADGRWNGAEMYTPKYTASHWSMLLLSEYGVDGSDPRRFVVHDGGRFLAAHWASIQSLPASQ